MAQSRGYVHRVDIRAGLDEIWQALIDPVILARWHVPNAKVDARVGGSYCTRLDANVVREAHIDVFLPPRRLRLIYMPLAGLPDDGAVLVDDFLIDRDEAASRDANTNITIVRLMGSGIPDDRAWDPVYTRLRNGWERALLRLKVSFERSEEAAVKRPGAASAAKKPPVEEQLLQWPEPSEKKPSGQNPLLGQPEPPKFDTSFANADGNDFIKWPEPTPSKKR
jgi:activator of Hsp90 ATPase-like protein